MFIYLCEKIKITLKKLLSKITRKRIPRYRYIRKLFNSKSGLEIGGSSCIFRNEGLIPLYRIIKGLDGCNFSNNSIWEGIIEGGENYNYYNKKKGFQYILEATDLSLIPNSKYDFILSSHCLEHIANPLKAIKQWLRVLKDEGLILLVLPNKEHCFDHKRSITDFSHLLMDFQNNTEEDDLTHLSEILELHDLQLDEPAGSFEQFRERSLKNFENRTLHHHVFNLNVLKEIFSYFKLEVLFFHEDQEFIIIGRKTHAS